METCTHCGEQIEDAPRYIGRSPYHLECGARLIVGGLNHQLGRCTCCPGGRELPDPPEMTRREAAVAAYEHWRKAWRGEG